MALELECKLVRKLPITSGNSARGPWQKQEFIVEYQDGNYPTQVCMNVWGSDKVRDLEQYQLGETLKASITISSREFNGRWYTDIRAWRLEKAGAAQTAAPQAAPAPQAYAPQAAPAYAPSAAPAPVAPAPTAVDFSEAEIGDDLPF